MRLFAPLLHARCWSTTDTAKGTTLSPISVCFISRCCCFFKRKKKKSGRQKWLSVTFGLGGAVQCAGNSAEPEGTTGTCSGAAVVATSRIGRGGAGTAADGSGDPEREAVTLLRVGSRSASRDSVLHTTVTMTPTPTPPPLSNWWTTITITLSSQPFVAVIICSDSSRDSRSKEAFPLANRADLFW